jgi:hypothetical protein
MVHGHLESHGGDLEEQRRNTDALHPLSHWATPTTSRGASSTWRRTNRNS